MSTLTVFSKYNCVNLEFSACKNCNYPRLEVEQLADKECLQYLNCIWIDILFIFVDGGRVIKRMRPAPQGRGYKIRKRSNHVTIIVDSKN